MNVIIKAIEFKDIDEDSLIEFISKNEKVQIVPLNLFVGKKHVLHSVNQTLKAFREGNNIAKKQNLEFVIRFTAERQISKALSKIKFNNN